MTDKSLLVMGKSDTPDPMLRYSWTDEDIQHSNVDSGQEAIIVGKGLLDS
jgi:hypothetical protein